MKHISPLACDVQRVAGCGAELPRLYKMAADMEKYTVQCKRKLRLPAWLFGKGESFGG